MRTYFFAIKSKSNSTYARFNRCNSNSTYESGVYIVNNDEYTIDDIMKAIVKHIGSPNNYVFTAFNRVD